MRIILAILLTLVSWTAASAQALRAGDTISISVYQDPKLDRNVLIGPTGMISFPLAGQIRAGGLTPAALESVLRNRLKDKFTEEPDITVALVAPFTDKPLEEDLKPRIFVTTFYRRYRWLAVSALTRRNGAYKFGGRSAEPK
jgi:polysaccharide biosynthesis/export protein